MFLISKLDTTAELETTCVCVCVCVREREREGERERECMRVVPTDRHSLLADKFVSNHSSSPVSHRGYQTKQSNTPEKSENEF